MTALTIDPNLYKRIQEAAQIQKASVDEMLDIALRRYLWDLDRRKISEESAIYHQRLAELKTKYLGQYIAMHNGEVVDHDSDFQTLRQRVRKRFGSKPIMITLVEERSSQVFTRHGFKVEQGAQ